MSYWPTSFKGFVGRVLGALLAGAAIAAVLRLIGLNRAADDSHGEAEPKPPARPVRAAEPAPTMPEPSFAEPLADGSAPGPQWTIKAKKSSMLFHTPASGVYSRTKADLWFRTEDDALASGFTKYR